MKRFMVCILLLAISACCSFAASDLCYVGSSGHLYLRSGGTSAANLPNELQGGLNKLNGIIGGASGGDKQITPNDMTGGICRMPLWLDSNRIIFVYDLNPNSSQPKTKVGILNLQTKKVDWISSLGGSISIGFDKATNTVDYMKILKKNTESDAFDVYLGQYSISKGKANSSLAYRGWGYIYPKLMWRWPEPGLRLLPVGTSDVSDQYGVYSPAKKKFIPLKWFNDDWKNANLHGWAVMSMGTGPNGMFAMSVFAGEEGQMGSNLFLLNKSTDAVKKVQTASATVRSPAFSSDGSMIAWSEENFNDSSKTVWISPTSNPRPQNIAKGWDPAWRP